jgi:hypothetical protein
MKGVKKESIMKSDLIHSIKKNEFWPIINSAFSVKNNNFGNGNVLSAVIWSRCSFTS